MGRITDIDITINYYQLLPHITIFYYPINYYQLLSAVISYYQLLSAVAPLIIINYYPTLTLLSVTSAVTTHQDASNKNQMWLWTEPLGRSRAMKKKSSLPPQCVFLSRDVCWFKIV